MSKATIDEDTIDVVFSFDTTGSMYPCLTQVRRYIEATVEELFDLIPNIRIGIISHGDYCDGDNCITSLDLTDNKRALCKFIKNAPATDGGDFDECYELVLNLARGMTWQSKRNKALVLIGDATPHEVGYHYRGRRNDLDWTNEAELLVEAGINILPVQALGRWGSSHFYESLADISDSALLELPQFNDITDIILAICHSRAKTLSTFEETLRERHKPASWHVMANIDRLAGRKVRTRPKTSTLDDDFKARTRSRGPSKSDTEGPSSYMGFEAMKDAGKKLIGVHPSRFQVLDVGDNDASINNFVRDNGIEFKKGRGFYEFTKPETIQAYKEVILEDPETGRFFTGNRARILAGLPIGEKGRFHPNPSKYTIFVQSTSANRRLKAGTRFLYEVPDLAEETPTKIVATGPTIIPPRKHKARKAHPMSRKTTPKKTSGRKCSLCGETGHNKISCPNVARCSICGKPGHNKRTCPDRVTPTPNPKGPGTKAHQTCSLCGKKGHNRRSCPN